MISSRIHRNPGVGRGFIILAVLHALSRQLSPCRLGLASTAT